MTMQQVISGRGQLSGQTLTALMAQLGLSRPMLVADERMAQVFADRTGLTLPVFGGFHANPDLADCAGGAALYRAQGCDGLISLGGGSAMDTAKGVKAMLLAPDENAVMQSRLPEGVQLPHIAIPATAGTGAEATPIAVVYVNNAKLSLDHPALLAEGVVLDGSLLDTLPVYHKKSCAMDALAQGIESFWACKATAESRVHAQRAIRGIMTHLPGYLAGSAKAQDGVLTAAYESGCAIRISRTTAAHAMSYQITKRLGHAHGHACMLTLPHLWAHLEKSGAANDVLAQLGACMGIADHRDGALLLQGLLADTGMQVTAMPDDATLDALAASVNTQRLGNHPEALTEVQLRQIYVAAFTPMDAAETERAIALWRHHAG